MKKLMLIAAICILAAMPSAAQPSWRVSHGINLTPEKTKIICKSWKLDSTEMFDVPHASNGKESGDGVTFNTDGSFSITKEGVAANGTWKAAGVYINTTSKTAGAASDTKMMFKAISIAADKLVLDYQTPDLITVRYTYLPKQ